MCCATDTQPVLLAQQRSSTLKIAKCLDRIVSFPRRNLFVSCATFLSHVAKSHAVCLRRVHRFVRIVRFDRMLRFSSLSDLRDGRVDLVLRDVRVLVIATIESNLSGCFVFAVVSVRVNTPLGVVAFVTTID